VVDRDAAVQPHQGEIAEADRKGQIAAQRLQDHLGGDVPPPECTVLIHHHHACPAPRVAPFYPNQDRLAFATGPPVTAKLCVLAI
jgi:hypothetical protein